MKSRPGVMLKLRRSASQRRATGSALETKALQLQAHLCTRVDRRIGLAVFFCNHEIEVPSLFPFFVNYVQRRQAFEKQGKYFDTAYILRQHKPHTKSCRRVWVW